MADADLYDYELPPELIAQQALDRRDAARLLVVRRSDGTLAHRHIRDLPDLLEPGDLVVVAGGPRDERLVDSAVAGEFAGAQSAHPEVVGQRQKDDEVEGVLEVVAPADDRSGQDRARMLLHVGHDELMTKRTIASVAASRVWPTRFGASVAACAVLVAAGVGVEVIPVPPPNDGR